MPLRDRSSRTRRFARNLLRLAGMRARQEAEIDFINRFVMVGDVVGSSAGRVEAGGVQSTGLRWARQQGVLLPSMMAARIFTRGRSGAPGGIGRAATSPWPGRRGCAARAR